MPTPPFRKLRVFAFDPSLSTQFDTAGINVVTLRVPWEANLKPGPVGEYLQVIDQDDAGQPLAGVDLNDPYILHEAGLPPSQANRHFHQQMVYAVVMATIKHFEDALGRPVQWSPRRTNVDGDWDEQFVPRLSIFPNAMEEGNAWYDPLSKSLNFGFLRPGPAKGYPDDAVVRTCLSQDIIAHEATHAILDGMHSHLLDDSNPDVLAFHEAIADIVALFQHFTHQEVLVQQIGRSQGDLEAASLLLGLARQLGNALSPDRGALRHALGEIDPKTGRRMPPDRAALTKVVKPHARAGILVGAVFDAFLTIYRNRTHDLVRLATGGRGVLPAGDLHPDLVNRLAEEASKAAGHMLKMCIRALDYLPPVDVTFGEFLRAVITADQDVVPDDDRHYRLAFIDAFGQRGIYPGDLECLAEDTLRWQAPSEVLGGENLAVFSEAELLRIEKALRNWRKSTARDELYRRGRRFRALLHEIFAGLCGNDDFVESADFKALTGLALGKSAPRSILRDSSDRPKFEIHAATLVRRVGPDGDLRSDLFVSAIQRRKGFFDPDCQRKADAGEMPGHVEPNFWFRGGCTLIVNLNTAEPRLLIHKDISSPGRLERQRDYQQNRRG
jgi:hypothetical protein